MLTRRDLLGLLSAGIGALIAAALGIPVLGDLLGPLFATRPSPFVSVGKVDDFAVGKTRLARFTDPALLPWSGLSAETSVWVRRTGDQQFDVFAIYCTHMGCPVGWRADSELFFCPCHGGVFYKDGQPAAGPPLTALHRREWRVSNGSLEVRPAGLPTLGAQE